MPKCPKMAVTEIGHLHEYAYRCQNAPFHFSLRWQVRDRREKWIGAFWHRYAYSCKWPISVAAILGHLGIPCVTVFARGRAYFIWRLETIKQYWRADKWRFWFNNAQIGQLVAQYNDLYILQLCYLFLSHVPSKSIFIHRYRVQISPITLFISKVLVQMEPTTALHSSESKQYDVTYRKGVDAFEKYELSKSKLEMTACLDILGRFHAKSRLDGKNHGSTNVRAYFYLGIVSVIWSVLVKVTNKSGIKWFVCCLASKLQSADHLQSAKMASMAYYMLAKIEFAIMTQYDSTKASRWSLFSYVSHVSRRKNLLKTALTQINPNPTWTHTFLFHSRACCYWKVRQKNSLVMRPVESISKLQLSMNG